MTAKEEKKVENVMKENLHSQFYNIVKRVVVSEKTTRMAEFENKFVFEVVRGATKPIIKLLVETEFGKTVKSVNTVNSIKGVKIAIVTFKEEGVASELSSELGLV